MEIEAFTNMVLEILRRQFPDRHFAAGEDIGVVSSGDLQFGLSNLLAQYQQASISDEEFEQAIQDSFRKMFEMVESGIGSIPEEWDDAKDRLRVQLVSQRIGDLRRAITFPFADDIVSSIVVDSPNGYAYVRPEDAERWNQTAVDLIEVAKENLLRESKRIEIAIVEGPPKLAVIQTNDGYDAARVLLPEIRQKLIEELVEQTGEEAMVGIPNRDFLIAWSTQAPETIQNQLAATVQQDAQSQSHPLSKRLYRISRDTITPT